MRQIPLCMNYFPEWDISLLCTPQVAAMPMATILRISNGCGRSGFRGKLVPDSLLGLDISPCCHLHDVDYQVAEQLAEKRLEYGYDPDEVQALLTEDENQADGRFGHNLQYYVKTKSGLFLRYPRLRLAGRYADAVAMTNVLKVADLHVAETMQMADNLKRMVAV